MPLPLEKTEHLSKDRQRELALVLVVIVVVALLSFGLGYTMAKDSARTPIIIENSSG